MWDVVCVLVNLVLFVELIRIKIVLFSLFLFFSLSNLVYFIPPPYFFFSFSSLFPPFYSAFSPWIVATTRLVCLTCRNSRYQMPCHVPVACFRATPRRTGGIMSVKRSPFLCLRAPPPRLFTYELAVLNRDRNASADQCALDMCLCLFITAPP